jgi:hypothetical protein
LEDKVERTEVSSSRSIEEVYENRWRKGLDGFDKTDVTYLKHKDSSCSKEVTYLKIDWKSKINSKNA